MGRKSRLTRVTSLMGRSRTPRHVRLNMPREQRSDDISPRSKMVIAVLIGVLVGSSAAHMMYWLAHIV